MSKPTFGDRLRKMRLNAKMTLATLAERSGLALQTVHRIESGDRPNPSWETVLALADALGVTPDAFTDDEPKEKKPRKRK